MYNIKYKGKYTDEEQLKKVPLPPNTVMFEEPDSILKIFLKGFILSLPLLLVIIAGAVFKFIISKYDMRIFMGKVLIYAAIANLVLMYVHEFIHAIFLPKEVEKEVWSDLSHGALFVNWYYPISKRRFIAVSLAPNIILGVIPYILFILGIFDFNSTLAMVIGTTSIGMIVGGIGDYLNVYNAFRQVPKGAKIQNYGMHSYWIKE